MRSTILLRGGAEALEGDGFNRGVVNVVEVD
jgi:hypothetical protein